MEVLDKALSKLGYKKTYKVVFDPPITILEMTIPARSEWLGRTAWMCPNCDCKDIHMFSEMDTERLIVRCDDCNLEVRHAKREVIKRFWRELA